MTADPLHGPRLKIRQSQERADDLEALVTGLFKATPFALVPDDLDPTTGDRWLRIKLVGSLPERVHSLVSEAVHPLRSALDLSAAALARANGASDAHIHFPFAGSRQDFEAALQGKKVKGIDAVAVDVIRRFQPYKGGNDFLWALNQLDNLDKHRDLVPVGTVGNVAAVGLHVRNAKVGFLMSGDRRLDKGIRVSNLGPDGEIRASNEPMSGFHISAGVAFDDGVDVLAGELVVPTLRKLAGVAEEIVNALARCFPNDPAAPVACSGRPAPWKW
jgi:hypothetical protein